MTAACSKCGYIGEGHECSDFGEDAEPFTAGALQGLIADALYLSDEACEIVADTFSFDAAGVLTNDSGLVVKTHDGSEFQVTIVRSR